MILVQNLRKCIDLIIPAIMIMSLCSCSESPRSLKEMKDYTGPLTTMHNVVNLMSDSARVKIRLTAPIQLKLKNGNETFPKGLKVEFYERDGTVSSIMTANKGVFDRTKNIFTATGNVVVDQILKNETLTTEELLWKRNEKQIFTDKFVTIKTEDEPLYGTGLTASEDLSTYKITDPTGSFVLDDEEEEDSVSEEE